MASSRHRRGPRPPSVKWPKAGQQQQRQPGKPSKPPQFHPEKGFIVEALCVGSPQHASTADASSRHRKGVEDQGIDRRTSSGRHRGDDSSASGIGEGPAVPPVDHQIKATEDFIGRAKKRLLQHDVVINEAQEALQKAESVKRAEVERLAEAEELLQRLRVQVPEVPQIPRSVTDLEQLVAQLQSERDGLVDQLKNQRSTRLVEMVHPLQSSEEAAQLVLERSSKRRAVGGWSPSNWSCEMLSRWATSASSGSFALPWFPTWFVETSSSVAPNYLGLAWRTGRRGFKPWACPNTKHPQIGRTIAGHNTGQC